MMRKIIKDGSDDQYLFVFSPNTRKYVPAKTPYLDTFHAVQTKITIFQYLEKKCRLFNMVHVTKTPYTLKFRTQYLFKQFRIIELLLNFLIFISNFVSD